MSTEIYRGRLDFLSAPLPQFRSVKDSGSAEGSYFAWVDQFNTLGLGNNIPIATGNEGVRNKAGGRAR